MRNACPICGREMHVPQHRHGQRWSPHAIAWVNQLHAVGLPIKAVAKLMDVPARTLASRIYDRRPRRYLNLSRDDNGKYKTRETAAS